ncbi:hypothetical protein [Pseudomonas fontis]|uniref:N-acetyltransferase domain-containing protein n=1 Tax=Pseudomonas fontis TaxID=2942633 RepID=A0ABT5NRH8_9PSED|nr:hypothetical protein [Pseudomonas fontis]MDD0976655.1 hypothetical protein [Pseudomonas fontis]MDD0990767.1 hypothetical protein [Pseudomonas fontis]
MNSKASALACPLPSAAPGSAGEITIEALSLDQHWAALEHLLKIEEWPFIRADLEVSHAQDRAFGLVARRNGEIKGFFTAHNFDDIVYLDLMVVEKSERTNVAMAAELWRCARQEIAKHGFRAQVAHCTNDSAPLLRLFGFTTSSSFTLVRREVLGAQRHAAPLAFLDHTALADLVELDAQVFGVRRESWISHLLGQPSTRFVGRYEAGHLTASVCLRTRRDNSLCIDAANSHDFQALVGLLDTVFAGLPDSRFECFVKTDSALHQYFLGNGFVVPEFFTPIGPLDELRLGAEHQVGSAANVYALAWL